MNDTSHEVAQGSHHLGGVAPTALSAHNIVKRFPGVLANDNVDFDVWQAVGSRAGGESLSLD